MKMLDYRAAMTSHDGPTIREESRVRIDQTDPVSVHSTLKNPNDGRVRFSKNDTEKSPETSTVFRFTLVSTNKYIHT